MFGARDVTLKIGSDVLSLSLEVARPGGRPPPPRPELAVGAGGAALLAGGPGGLGVVGAHLGVVAKVGGVLLVTETVGWGALVTRGTV